MSSQGLASRTWADLRLYARQALAYQLVVQLAVLALVGPLVT